MNPVKSYRDFSIIDYRSDNERDRMSPYDLGVLLLNGYILSDAEYVQRIIRYGADVNIQGPFAWTPLLQATFDKKYDIRTIRLLIEAGADIDAQNKDGYAPLHHAAEYCGKDVLEVFIAAGVQLDIQNRLGWTPLHVASYYRNVDYVEMLIAAGASIGIVNTKNQTAWDLAPLDVRNAVPQLYPNDKK